MQYLMVVRAKSSASTIPLPLTFFLFQRIASLILVENEAGNYSMQCLSASLMSTESMNYLYVLSLDVELEFGSKLLQHLLFSFFCSL